MREFVVSDWKTQLKQAETSDWKEPFYLLARPLLNLFARRHLQKETIEKFRPDLVLPGRGFPLRTRRRWSNAYKPLTGKTILVQGTGNGWDAVSWAKHKPKKIIAVDLFAFDSWKEVRKYVISKFGVEIEFHATPLHNLNFINNQAIDICASDAVFEHVQNLQEVMLETNRILKPDGFVYATYGPLWYCAGGDHFARGGLKNIFNHILINEKSIINILMSTDTQRSLFNQEGATLRSIYFLD